MCSKSRGRTGEAVLFPVKTTAAPSVLCSVIHRVLPFLKNPALRTISDSYISPFSISRLYSNPFKILPFYYTVCYTMSVG